MAEQTSKDKPSLFGIIINPKEQLKKIKENPKIIIPLLIVIGIYIVGTMFTLSQIEIPSLTDESITENNKKVLDVFYQIGIIITGIILPLSTILLSTLVYFLVAKMVQSAVTFKQLFSMSTNVTIITGLGFLVQGILIPIKGGVTAGDEIHSLPTSLGFILNQEQNIILSQIELFSIWHLIISAFGLIIVANFSKGIAWAVPIGMYVVNILMLMARTNVV